MPQEFVSRIVREKEADHREYLLSMDGNVPQYVYVRIAKIHNNFPVLDYGGPGVVAFMNPETLDVVMPTPERIPYGSADHVRHHETLHVYAAISHGDHDERGFNNMAVDALRAKSGRDFFPFPSY